MYFLIYILGGLVFCAGVLMVKTDYMRMDRQPTSPKKTCINAAFNIIVLITGVAFMCLGLLS